MTASNQFALLMLGYVMWVQQWQIMDIQDIDRKACKIVTESGRRHPCVSNAILYLLEEQAEEMGRRSMIKDAFRFTEELVSSLHLSIPEQPRRNCESVK